MERGARLEAWLKAKGRTRLELATHCGVTTSAVCLWIGGGGVTQANLNKIVEFVGVSMAVFYGRVPKAKKAA